MCPFVSFSGHCLSFQHFTVSCHSRIFKMFYLEMNVCKKCSENENQIQFCAHQLKSIRDWFLECGEGYFEASFTAETRLWCGKSVIFISFTVKNKKPVSLICEITPVLEKKNTVFGLKCRLCRSDWYRFECWPPHTVEKPFNLLSVFTVGKMESSACICGPKCAFRSNFGHFEPKNLKKILIYFLIKMGVCFQEVI